MSYSPGNRLTVGTPGATSLVDYGIHNEKSDLRVHVCVNAARAYVFPTRDGIAAINSGHFRRVPAYQSDVTYATAEGFLVPPTAIARCLPVSIRWALTEVGGIAWNEDTTAKGIKAVQVVRLMLYRGWFPLWGTPSVVADVDLQIDGLDIIVRQQARIQVKCDYEGGAPPRAGEKGQRITGNLFLQVAECNPLRRI